MILFVAPMHVALRRPATAGWTIMRAWRPRG
jgi:hypothetical protein